MPEVRPFVGLLYDPDVGGPPEAVTAPPYDTISPIDQDRYYRASPFNVVRLILGKTESGDGSTDNKYTRAASYLRTWRDQGVLRATASPALFPYELRFHVGGVERRLRGVIAEVGLERWGGSILAHERTMPGPIEDRLRLLREVAANLSPIYVVLGGPSPALTAFLEEAMAQPHDREITDGAGTRHRLWVSTEGTEPVTQALRDETLLIADGHHRYSVGLAYQTEMQARFGPGPWDSMMMLIVDGATEDPPVLPIHRLVLEGRLDGFDAGEPVRDMAEVLASLHDDEPTFGTFRLEDGEPVHRVGRLEGPPPTVCLLHERILDRGSDLRLRFVPDAVAVERAVLSGQASVAFLLPPTRVDRVRAIIQAGGVLPQKSTYFWPKPRTGLVLRPLQIAG
jgi:uncharacterized protein (DUF1015 family)